MQTIREMIQQIQTITHDAYKSSSQAAALLKTQAGPPEAMAKALERTAAQMEQGTVELRALCERCLPDLPAIGQNPFYGYVKGTADRRRLEVDPIAAETVRLVFRLWLEGNSIENIAAMLNERKIPSPSARKRELGG